MISDDDENPIWTKADFARARGPESMTAAELAAFPNTRRIGRPPKETPKVPVNLRLDADVVEHFKAAGAGWQTRMNAVLRQAAELDRSRADERSMGAEEPPPRARTIDMVEESAVGKEAFVTEEIAFRKDTARIESGPLHPSNVRPSRYAKALPPRGR